MHTGIAIGFSHRRIHMVDPHSHPRRRAKVLFAAVQNKRRSGATLGFFRAISAQGLSAASTSVSVLPLANSLRDSVYWTSLPEEEMEGRKRPDDLGKSGGKLWVETEADDGEATSRKPQSKTAAVWTPPCGRVRRSSKRAHSVPERGIGRTPARVKSEPPSGMKCTPRWQDSRRTSTSTTPSRGAQKTWTTRSFWQPPARVWGAPVVVHLPARSERADVWPAGGKLYLPPGGKYYGCRHCYDLTYESSQTSHSRIRRLFLQYGIRP